MNCLVMFWKSLVRLVCMLAVPVTALAAIDRHPELKSRPFAWTEYDGSYLVDTNSRAEMLDLWWTVFARPIPKVEWTGSLNPQVAGTISEQFRLRNYSQLNAYRALNYSPAMHEDESFIPLVQEGALVIALNPDKPVTHNIDSSWFGYTAFRAQAVNTSLLTGYDPVGGDPSIENPFPMSNPVDGFIIDPGDWNAGLVGHRAKLLHDANTTGTLGQAFSPSKFSFAAVWHTEMQSDFQAPPENFTAWPAPGYCPFGFFRNAYDPKAFRWSFQLTNDNANTRWAQEATVSAKINGVATPVRNIVRNYGSWTITWEFDPALLNLGTAPDGTQVEIEIGNVRDVPLGSGITRTYRYAVTFFDENLIVKSGFSPKTPLKNISTRGEIGTGERQMIAGFVVTGDAPVRVALRTQGPGLARYGLQNVARRTKLELYDANNVKLGENSGWKSHQDWRLLQSLDVNPSEDSEAGMVATLWPGKYTAIVSDDTGSNGIGIVEAFAIDNLSESKLGNLSTRGVVGTSENALIAGFILNEPRTVLIRTQGPGLARYGISGPVMDTKLEVTRSDGTPIAQNDDWQADARNARLLADLAALAPSDACEAALILTLPAGGYTALVSGKTNSGVGIVEVFDLGR